MQNARGVSDPRQGPSGHGPSAHVLGSRATALRTATGDMYADPFADAYPGFDAAHVGYVFTLEVPPRCDRGAGHLRRERAERGLRPAWRLPDSQGRRAALHVERSSVCGRRCQDSRRRFRDRARHRPGPAAGRRARPARPHAPAAIADRQLGPARAAPHPRLFTVFEQSVEQLQAAMTAGTTTSEDIVREYLTRATVYDRHGPTFKALLALNPRAIADARAARRDAGGGPRAGPLPRRADRAQGQHRRHGATRPPAARWRCAIIGRASTPASPRA